MTALQRSANAKLLRSPTRLRRVARAGAVRPRAKLRHGIPKGVAALDFRLH